jgi:autoinducer 2-degrading protein
MLVLHVTVRVKPERAAEFLPLARENAEQSVKEPGCLRFDIVQDRDDPHCFRFYEVYRDDAALASHRTTAHFKKYFETTLDWMAEPVERRLGTLIVPE